MSFDGGREMSREARSVRANEGGLKVVCVCGGAWPGVRARVVWDGFVAAFNYCKIRLFDYGGAMNGLRG